MSVSTRSPASGPASGAAAPTAPCVVPGHHGHTNEECWQQNGAQAKGTGSGRCKRVAEGGWLPHKCGGGSRSDGAGGGHSGSGGMRSDEAKVAPGLMQTVLNLMENSNSKPPRGQVRGRSAH